MSPILRIMNILLLIPTHKANADMIGPMIFYFELNSKSQPPVDVTLLEFHTCSDFHCSQPSKPEFLKCVNNLCEFRIYPTLSNDYAQVTGMSSDGKHRESRVFQLPNLLYFGIQLTFDVFVHEDKLSVYPIPFMDSEPYYGFAAGNILMSIGAVILIPGLLVTLPRKGQKPRTSKRYSSGDLLSTSFWFLTILISFFTWMIFGALDEPFATIALSTIAIECGLSLLYAFLCKMPMKHFITIILLANMISIALLQFILTTGLYLFQPSLLYIGELVVWILEALLLYIIGGRSLKLSVKETLLISLFNNVASLIAGFLLYI